MSTSNSHLINTVVHIGYPKSGSTTLQRQIFAAHPSILYLGIFPKPNNRRSLGNTPTNPYVENDVRLQEWHRELVTSDRSQFDKRDHQQLFYEIVSKHQTSQKLCVISNERISSVFFALPDLREKAKRIKSLFPNAEILIVLRNQLDLIRSQYRDQPFDPFNMADGRPLTFNDWLERLWKQKLFLSSLRYDELIQCYEELFSVEHVHILLLEDLVHKPQRFASGLADVLHIDACQIEQLLANKRENAAASERYFQYRRVKRYAGRLLPKKWIPIFVRRAMDDVAKRFIGNGPAKSVEWTEWWIERLQTYYASSNARLAQLRNLDLVSYNYPLG